MSANTDNVHPYLGFGLGLRVDHYETILNSEPAVDWFEILSENYLVPGGKPLRYLDRIRERFPLVMHGSSSVPKEWVDRINAAGGAMKNTSGVTLEIAGSIMLTMRPVGAEGTLLVGSVIQGEQGNPGQTGPPGPPA